MSITTLTRHEVPLNYFNWMNRFNNVSEIQTWTLDLRNLLESNFTYAIQSCLPILLTSTSRYFQQVRTWLPNTIRSYVKKNLFTDNKLQLDEASYSNNCVVRDQIMICCNWSHWVICVLANCCLLICIYKKWI